MAKKKKAEGRIDYGYGTGYLAGGNSGLSEFLPISSSAHLILPSQILGWPDQGLAFDVAVHVGSFVAVVIYFRRDIQQLITAWLRSLVAVAGNSGEPPGLVYYSGHYSLPVLQVFCWVDFIEANLSSMAVIALNTIGFGLLLGLG